MGGKVTHTPWVISDRGGVIENRHQVHAAVVDAKGKLLFYVGGPSRVTLIRSAAKPAQALAVLETPGFDQCGFDDADLALMCASHNSEEMHIVRAREILIKAGAKEENLRCGGHAALSETVNRNWIKSDYTPTAVCSNCSGKHAGMLAATKAIDADVTSYHHEKHPIQQRVKRAVEECSGLDPGDIHWATDGCNLPAPAMPLQSLATTYATFAAAADDYDSDKFTSTRTRALSRIFHAMGDYPELVGGTDRFCTVLMRAFQGSLIGKLGADGCYGIGIRASEQTARLGAEGGIGISVKIEDGSIPILYCAVVEILHQLEIGSPDMREELDGFHHLAISNTAGVVTGHVVPAFQILAV